MTNKARFKYRPLQAQELRELATLITSGIPISEAWTKSSAMTHPAARTILQQLEKGSSLPTALKFLNLVNMPQQIYLDASNDSGTLSEALQRLASDYENREARTKKLKSKFYIIYLLLFVGWGASITLVIAADGPVTMSFIRNTLWCLVCYAITRKTVSLVLKDGWWWLNKAWGFGLRQHKAYQWTLVTHWYALLSKQLAAGVDAGTALRKMDGLLNQASYRQAIAAAATDLEKGQSLNQSLADHNLLPNAEFRSVLVSAEASGRLSELLDQQAIIAEQNLDRFQDTVMMWVPKGLYGMCGAVALVMVL